MKIKYVGAKPVVSQHGVSFDQSKPDRYTFIEPALRILEQIEDKESGVIVLDTNMKSLSDSQILEKVKHYCDDIEKLSEERVKKTEELIKELEKIVNESTSLGADEKRAYLGNIKIMTNYYLQYITNELVYKCMLEKLADKLTHSHIEKLEFNAVNNFGLTLSHLITIIRDHKPHMDATLSFDNKDGQIVGIFNTNRK